MMQTMIIKSVMCVLLFAGVFEAKKNPSPKLVFVPGQENPWTVELSRGPTLIYAEDVEFARPLKLPKLQDSAQQFPVLRIVDNQWVVDDYMTGAPPSSGSSQQRDVNVGKADVINTFVLAGKECLEEAGIVPGDIQFGTSIKGATNNYYDTQTRPKPVEKPLTIKEI